MRRDNTFSEIVKATGREYAIQENDGIIRLTLDGKPLDDDPADCDCEDIEEAEKYYSRYLMEHVIPKDKRYLMHGRWLLKPDVVYELGDMMDDDTIVSYPSASAIIRELERLGIPEAEDIVRDRYITNRGDDEIALPVFDLPLQAVSIVRAGGNNIIVGTEIESIWIDFDGGEGTGTREDWKEHPAISRFRPESQERILDAIESRYNAPFFLTGEEE